MCYDISFATSIRVLSDYFPELVIDPQINMEFSQDHIQGTAVFPEHPIIFRDENGVLCLRLMKWSAVDPKTTQIPDYKSKDYKYLQGINWKLNARSEKVFNDKYSLWHRIRNNRCLVPVSGVFEHRGIVGYKGWKNKLPYHISLKDNPLFFLPGMFSVYHPIDKETGEVLDPHYTFTLDTRPANETMCMIHNSGDNPFRMPLFIPFPMAVEYISKDLTDKRYQEILEYEIPPKDLDYYTVFTIRSSKPHPMGLRKHERYDWPENPPPPLGEYNPPVEAE